MSEDFPFQFFPGQTVVCNTNLLEGRAGKIYLVESTQLQWSECKVVYLLKINGAWQQAEHFIPLAEWERQEVERENAWNPILGEEVVARTIVRNRKD